MARIDREPIARVEDLLVLAVLPFRPLAAEERDPGLELGMADALITRLARLRQLVVRPLATVRQFTDLEQDPLVAGRELGAGVVVDGSLHRFQDRVRVSVRLLKCDDGRALFAQHYDEAFGDLFSLQDSVCRKISSAVSLKLDRADAVRLEKHETDDLQAYRHFLRGRMGLGRMVPEDAARSIGHFEKALECDPSFAEALVGIAEANMINAWQGVVPGTYYDKARQAAQKALDLDDELGIAWSWLATVAWEYDWDWQSAERHFQHAVALAPNVIDIWGRYSASCAFSGRGDEAVELGRRAVELDSSSPMAVAWLGQALHMAGRSAEAIDLLESAIAASADIPFARFILGLACVHGRLFDRAIESLEQAAATGRPDFLGVLGHAYVRAGQHDDAAAIEATLAEGPPSACPPVALAMIHAARDDTDRFFESMERCFEQPSLHAVLIASEPLFEQYRAHPRGAALIRRLGLGHLASASAARDV